MTFAAWWVAIGNAEPLVLRAGGRKAHSNSPLLPPTSPPVELGAFSIPAQPHSRRYQGPAWAAWKKTHRIRATVTHRTRQGGELRLDCSPGTPMPTVANTTLVRG